MNHRSNGFHSQSGANGSPPNATLFSGFPKATAASNPAIVNGHHGTNGNSASINGLHGATDGTSQPSHAGERIPNVGIFWDIENCRLPANVLPRDVATRIREVLCEGQGRTYGIFRCCCDIVKMKMMNPLFSRQFEQANIRLTNSESGAKNGADFQLIQEMRDWVSRAHVADVIVLISGDINFAHCLDEFRSKNRLYIILLHPPQVNHGLLMHAHEHYLWEQFLNGLGASPAIQAQTMEREEDRQVIIRGIPPGRTYEQVFTRLKNLSSSYGGNIDLRMNGLNPYAIITCSSISYAKRLKHGMHLEDCCGGKLQTSYRPGSSLYREEYPSEVRTYRPPEFGRVYPPVQPSLHPSYTDPCLPSKGRPRFGLSAYPSIPSDSSIQYEAPILPDGMPGLNSAPVDPAPLPPTTRPAKSSINGSNDSHKPPRIVFDARTAAAPTVPTSVLKKDKLSGMQRFILQDQERRLAAELKDLAVSDSNKVESTPTTPPKVSVKTTKDNAPVPELSIAKSAPVKHLVDTSDKTATDVYVTNLDVITDRDVLCAKLMQLLEPVVPISFVSVYLDQLGLAFAHVIVLGKDNVEKLLNFANNTVFGGKRLSASLDDPSLPVPEIVQRSIVEIFKIHKKDEMAYMDLVRYFELEHDVILDLRTIRKMSSIVEDLEHDGRKWVRLRGAGIALIAVTAANEGKPRLEKGYCETHCAGLDIHKAFPKKQYNPSSLYRTSFGLAIFKDHIIELLKQHGNAMPINSFLICYEALYPKHLVEDLKDGVYLEHLLLSVPGVSIEQKALESRKLILRTGVENGSSTEDNDFAEDVAGILTSTDRAAYPVQMFMDRYHALIGLGSGSRTRYIDHDVLLRELQDVTKDIQVVGLGASRIVTLTHEAQKRRFKADLALVQEKYPPSSITAANFAERYRDVMGRPFAAKNYGVCHLEDLFDGIDVPYLAPEVTGRPKGHAVAGDTAEAVVNKGTALHILTAEVIALLNFSPKYRLNLIRFPASYHQMFKKQLTLRKYGWTKLVDLITTLPEILEVIKIGQDRFIQLTLEKRREDFQEFGRTLAGRKQEYGLQEIRQIFSETFRPGKKLMFDDYGCASWDELIFNFSDIFQVLVQPNGNWSVRIKPAQPIPVDSPPASTGPSSSASDAVASTKLTKNQRRAQRKLEKKAAEVAAAAKTDAAPEDDSTGVSDQEASASTASNIKLTHKQANKLRQQQYLERKRAMEAATKEGKTEDAGTRANDQEASTSTASDTAAAKLAKKERRRQRKLEKKAAKASVAEKEAASEDASPVVSDREASTAEVPVAVPARPLVVSTRLAMNFG